MPKWILICKNCKLEFEHSRISDVGIASFYLPLKREIQPGNVSVCSNCGHGAVYERRELIYQAV
jgi:hypothetical protein